MKKLRVVFWYVFRIIFSTIVCEEGNVQLFFFLFRIYRNFFHLESSLNSFPKSFQRNFFLPFGATFLTDSLIINKKFIEGTPCQFFSCDLKQSWVCHENTLHTTNHPTQIQCQYYLSCYSSDFDQTLPLVFLAFTQHSFVFKICFFNLGLGNFVGLKLLRTKFFGPKIFLFPKLFCSKMLLYIKFFFGPTFGFDQNYFSTQNFF